MINSSRAHKPKSNSSEPASPATPPHACSLDGRPVDRQSIAYADLRRPGAHDRLPPLLRRSVPGGASDTLGGGMQDPHPADDTAEQSAKRPEVVILGRRPLRRSVPARVPSSLATTTSSVATASSTGKGGGGSSSGRHVAGRYGRPRRGVKGWHPYGTHKKGKPPKRAVSW
jgi:hypothetical protein